MPLEEIAQNTQPLDARILDNYPVIFDLLLLKTLNPDFDTSQKNPKSWDAILEATAEKLRNGVKNHLYKVHHLGKEGCVTLYTHKDTPTLGYIDDIKLFDPKNPYHAFVVIPAGADINGTYSKDEIIKFPLGSAKKYIGRMEQKLLDCGFYREDIAAIFKHFTGADIEEVKATVDYSLGVEPNDILMPPETDTLRKWVYRALIGLLVTGAGYTWWQMHKETNPKIEKPRGRIELKTAPTNEEVGIEYHGTRYNMPIIIPQKLGADEKHNLLI